MLNLTRKLTTATASAAILFGGAGLSQAADEPRAGITPPPAVEAEQQPEVETFTGRVMPLRDYMMHGVSAAEAADRDVREQTDRTQAKRDANPNNAARASEARSTPGRDINRADNESEQAELETPEDIANAKAEHAKAEHAKWSKSHGADHGPMVLVLTNDGVRAIVPGRTAYVIMPSDASGKHLKAQCANANGHPVKVTAREYQRGGLNLLVVESIQSTDGTDLGSDKLHSDRQQKADKSDKANKDKAEYDRK